MAWETWVMVILHSYLTMDIGSSSDMRSSNVLRVFRLFRLTRVARISRLMRTWPELVITIKGLATAIQSVAATLCLLFLVIYVFSVMFTELLATTEVGQGRFENVPQAMHFCLIQVVCGFDASFVSQMLATSWVYYMLWLVYLFLCSLTIMNLLTGVLVEIVSRVASEEKELFTMKELEDVVGKLVPSGHCSEKEFFELIQNPLMMQQLSTLGVDVFAFEDFTSFIYEFESGELSMRELLDLIFQFRGDKSTTVKDIVDLRKFVTMELANLEARLVAPPAA
jgi:hypothetical protein